MKKYKYVVVSGCSLSVDPPHNSADLGIPKDGKSYGKLISKHYGAKCYDLASCGNSMQGIHRRILDWCGKNTDKFEDTLILVGVTITGRKEIWNNKSNEWHSDTEYFQPPRSQLDRFKDRLLIYWPPEQRKNYWINFHNENAEFFLMTQNIIGLQSFLTLNNIDHVFFDAMGPLNKYWENTCDDKEDKFGHKLLFDNLVSQENWYKNSEYKALSDFTEKNIEMRIGPTDLGEDFHPNKKGHKYWAKCLMEFIDEKINT